MIPDPSLPIISIVTPSFNQAIFIGETLQSLVDQEYPNLEVIIQEAGSTDGSIELIEEFVRKHPKIFTLHIESDRGQAHALNLGFAKANGKILGFLNSDDTLYPGCLHRVAKEIDPSSGRYIIMGRCLFTGEDSPYVGVEHPAVYLSHFEHLAIWKRGFNTIPQPSVFWHREVWEKCGPLDESQQHVLDYDLFCRFSQSYHFHTVDQLFSTYRMHAASKSSARTETEVLEMSITVSQKYWGPRWHPLYWRCLWSFWRHSEKIHELARHHGRACEAAAKQNLRIKAVWHFGLTSYYSPKMGRDRLLLPWLAKQQLNFVQRWLLNQEGGFSGLYEDNWIGPYFKMPLPERPTEDKRAFLVELTHSPQGAYRNVTTSIHCNRKKICRHSFSDPDVFRFTIEADELKSGANSLEIRCNAHFIPRQLHNTPDDRRLSLILTRTEWV